MRIVQLGYGYFGKKIAASLPSKWDTLYVSDLKFNKDNLPESDLPNIEFVPFTSIGELHQQISPAAYYLAVPQEHQLEILKYIPPHIPVLVEKPAIGGPDNIQFVGSFRPLNTVAVGHTFLQCNGFKYIKEQLLTTKSPVCIYSERTNTNGPIRENISCQKDLAIHDVSLFWDILKTKYPNVNYGFIEYRFLYGNRFASRFMLSYDNLFMDVKVSWIGKEKRRDWYVNFSNEQLHWDAINDTVISDFNGELVGVDAEGRSPLQKQWQHLLDWAKIGGNCPPQLHSLNDALVCSYYI